MIHSSGAKVRLGALGLCFALIFTAQSPWARRRLARRAAASAARSSEAGSHVPASRYAPAEATLFQKNAGRVSWYKGAKHDLIAFDSITDEGSKNMEVFTIHPDGTGKTCVTCSSGIRKGFTGQMEWLPDGDHMLVMGEGPDSRHQFYNHPSFGIDSEMWIIRRDGTGAVKMWSTSQKGGGTLHPRVSPDGRLVVFAERSPTGRQLPLMLRHFGPEGESPWDGWRIHVADLSMGGDRPRLTNHRTIMPNGPGFYETTGFSPDGKIVYSYTRQGLNYSDDIYTCNIDGSGTVNLTRSPSTWDEHGVFSPDGRYLAFMSSRFDPSLVFPGARPAQLRTELYLSEHGGEPVQITKMNEIKGTKTVVSRFDWNRASNRIVAQVADLSNREKPELWMIVIR